MFVNPSELRNAYDLCIVGAGPAGIILALEFARHSPEMRVLLIEFGGKATQRNRLDDSIINRNNVNHFDPYDCTTKGLGGTTATWGGRCVMFDPVDFVPHGPVLEKDCTWDSVFLQRTLDFVSTASDYFQCGSGAFDLASSDSDYPPIAEGFVEGDVTSTSLERWSLPTRFGSEFGKKLKQAPNIDVLQGFEARDFECDGRGKAHSLVVKSSSTSHQARICAKRFVLSCGGQEATRILLRNPNLFDSVGGTPHALGRYYQGHISGKIANVRFFGDPNKTQYGYTTLGDKALCRRRFQFTQALIQREGLLNTAFWLDNLPVYDARHRNGTLSLIYLIMIMPGVKNRLLHAAMIRTLTNDKVADLRSHLLNVLRRLPTSLVKTLEICLKRYLPRRKLPGIHLKNPDNLYALHFHAEQIPRFESCMYLGEDNETLIIDYSYSDEEIDRCIKAHRILDKRLKELNCGKLEYYHETEDQLRESIRLHSKDGLHQIGTTRIAPSAKDGVVDANLKVFGTENVYVCTSSVFPNSGQANPTFFLGVCAAMLAEQLARIK